MKTPGKLPPYRRSLAGTMLAAREAVMAPIRPVLREQGLTEQQWRVLRVLADEGPIDPSRLAAAALLHAPSVTRILRELGTRSLIDRIPDANDGRRSIVAVSKSGAELMRRTAERTLDLLDTYSDLFGPDRLRALMTELRAFTLAIAALDRDQSALPITD